MSISGTKPRWKLLFILTITFIIVTLLISTTTRTFEMAIWKPFIEEFDGDYRNYSLPGCSCPRSGLNIESVKRAQKMAMQLSNHNTSSPFRKYAFEGESACSDYSTQRGSGQKVISYTFFTPTGKVNMSDAVCSKYLQYLDDRASDILKQYPGWLMRIYHNTPDDDDEGNSFLCKIYCNFQHVDLCHVQRLPEIGNLIEKKVIGRAWRFAVLGDATVETFVCRDSDSYLIDREVTAVNQWMASDKTFHIMRDHPMHKSPVYAGLWGGHNKNLEKNKKMRDDMFAQPPSNNKYYDQALLAKYFWPHIKGDVMQHDSYHCLVKDHRDGATSFPTQRVNGQYCAYPAFITGPVQPYLNKPCPEECRPKDHKDWITC